MSNLAELPRSASRMTSPARPSRPSGTSTSPAGVRDGRRQRGTRNHRRPRLRAHVRGGPCRVYITNMKLRVDARSAFFYPDLLVTCDPADAAEPVAKRHARVVIEVLSESSEGCDRSGKFAAYRTLDSLESMC